MTTASRISRSITTPEARTLAVLGGSSSAAPLDIKASVGSSTSPTVTGNKAVTGVGFTPKAVLPFGIMSNVAGAQTEVTLSVGAAKSAANRFTIAAASQFGVPTSATYRRHDNANMGTYCYGGSTAFSQDLVSFDADGFTSSWVMGAALALIQNHICLGGADLEVNLVQCQMNGTNAAQSFAHGLTGAPTGLLFFSSINNAAPANTSASALISLGMWAVGNQCSAGFYDLNGTTTTQTNRLLSNSSVYSHVNPGSYQRSMAVGSVDATNVNVTYPVAVGSYDTYFWMLAIRGAKCQVGTFNCNGSTSPLIITTTGITPKLFLPIFVPSGVSSVGTVLNDLLLHIGASDGTNNVSCGISDANGVGSTNARRSQSSASLAEYSIAGAKQFEATAAFSGKSVVLTPTTAVATYGQGGYLVIGA